MDRDKKDDVTRKIGAARPSDIIDLNVGGTRITTTRSTLCQVEGSMLAAMFSGVWEGRLVKDQHGAYVLDLDPYCMNKLLAYLRSMSLSPPCHQVPNPIIENGMKMHWKLLVDFLDVSRLFDPPPALPLLTFSESSPTITKSNHSLTARGYSSNPTGRISPCPPPIIGTITCTPPITMNTIWVVTLGTWPGSRGCLSIVLIDRDVGPYEIDAMEEKDGYGWSISPHDQTYRVSLLGHVGACPQLRRRLNSAGQPPGSQPVDLMIKVDMGRRQAVLSTNYAAVTPSSFCRWSTPLVPLPEDVSVWYPHLRFHEAEVQVTIRQATEEEAASGYPAVRPEVLAA